MVLNQSELPRHLQTELDKLITVCDSGSPYLNELNVIWDWLNQEHNELLIDAYCDWVVADVKAIANDLFNDEALKDVQGTLNMESISDEQRIEFALSQLSIGDYEDGERYPSPALITLESTYRTICIGYLLRPHGSGIVDIELIGAFGSENDFHESLTQNLFLDIDATKISDETIMSFWS